MRSPHFLLQKQRWNDAGEEGRLRVTRFGGFFGEGVQIGSEMFVYCVMSAVWLALCELHEWHGAFMDRGYEMTLQVR